MKTSHILIAIAIIALIIIGGWLLLSGDDAEAPTEEEEGSPTTSGMLAEPNAVLVVNQRPDADIMVAQAHLERPGYVVIHKDDGGNPGAIVGSSELLKTGQSDRVNITISEIPTVGDTYYAMLHFEESGDSTFDATVDAPVSSEIGGIIMSSFQIEEGANEDVEVTL